MASTRILNLQSKPLNNFLNEFFHDFCTKIHFFLQTSKRHLVDKTVEKLNITYEKFCRQNVFESNGHAKVNQATHGVTLEQLFHVIFTEFSGITGAMWVVFLP